MSRWLESQVQAISELTLKEWVEIRATLHAIENEKFNCRKCVAKYQGRADGDTMLAKVQKLQGCKEMLPQPTHKIGEEMSFRSCIGNFTKPQVHALLEAFNRFEQGVLPYAGGLMDQPAKIMAVFDVISAAKAKRQADAQKKAELIARQKGGRRV